MSPALLSSKRMDWETPWSLVRWAERSIMGHTFTLDACAKDQNAAKAPTWIPPEVDGLSTPWTGRVYCNPPYGREQIRWIERAHEQSKDGADFVVMLLPARTDTRVFHRVIAPNAEVILLAGRVRFELDGVPQDAAPFPSMLAVFSRYRRAGIFVADVGNALVTGERVARGVGVGRTEVAGCSSEDWIGEVEEVLG
jgi:hypothetical protein